MKRQTSIGLDELMIVNPGRPGLAGPASAECFLGDYGELYQVSKVRSEAGLDGFYLGDDGRLYQLQGLQALSGLAGVRRLPHLFLGENGTLYEIENR